MEQLGVDDWADQGLLTKQEARDRLVEEIRRTRALLEQLYPEGADSRPEFRLLERRLKAMESTCGEYDGYLDET